MHFEELCIMYATASLHFHPHVERYCMSRQRSVYSLTFVHIYTYKWLCSLWPFIFLFFSFLFLLSLAGIANCIVLELEFRNVQLQYLWNGNYKILMTENQPSCPVCFFSLHVEDVKKMKTIQLLGFKWLFYYLHQYSKKNVHVYHIKIHQKPFYIE